MKELIHIRHKINARIKSIGDGPQAIYAKKMMRRCIKDIDAVIDAQKVTKEMHKYNLEGFPLMRDIFKKSEVNSERDKYISEIKSTESTAAAVKKVTGEVAKCKTPLDRFNEGAEEVRITENPMWKKLKGQSLEHSKPTIERGAALDKMVDEIALDEKRQAKFDKLYGLLRRGVISDEFFLSSILDGTI